MKLSVFLIISQLGQAAHRGLMNNLKVIAVGGYTIERQCLGLNNYCDILYLAMIVLYYWT